MARVRQEHWHGIISQAVALRSTLQQSRGGQDTTLLLPVFTFSASRTVLWCAELGWGSGLRESMNTWQGRVGGVAVSHGSHSESWVGSALVLLVHYLASK